MIFGIGGTAGEYNSMMLIADLMSYLFGHRLEKSGMRKYHVMKASQG